MEILVPLTTSLYYSGKLDKVDTVMVDIGTGYFVEKVLKFIIEYRILLMQKTFIKEKLRL